MRSYLTLLLSAALIAFMAGCAKKPQVEAPTTKTPVGETKPTTPPESTKSTEPVETEPSSRFAAIYFDFDKYNLTEDALGALKKNVEVMKQDPNINITIEGNCDERGTVEYNLALGERRAKSARDYLISSGIKSNRISIISYGKERPKAMGHDESSWGQNRRDDFVEK